MSELRDAAQELLDFYDSLRAKYGRIAEYKSVGKKVERLRKAVENDGPDICDACEERPPEICWVCAQDAGADRYGEKDTLKGWVDTTCPICSGTGRDPKQDSVCFECSGEGHFLQPKEKKDNQ